MRSVAIIGGGVASVLLSLNIKKNDPANKTKIFIVEKNPEQLGKGPAYSTMSDNHFLNVPASRMSLINEEPGHFVDWLKENQHNYLPDDFVPRKLFGKYVDGLFQDLLVKYPDSISVIPQEATSISSDSNKIQFLDGSSVEVDKIILSLGNFPPRSIRFLNELDLPPDSYIENPWNLKSSDIIQHPSICIIGSGLTAVDVVMDLYKSNYQGIINCVSFKGFFPLEHSASHASSSIAAPKLEGPLAKKSKKLREWLSSPEHTWQSGFDTMRPQIQNYWQGLTLKEQKSFLRHMRIYWDIHRHRLDPKIHSVIEDLIKKEKLIMHAGRVIGAEKSKHGIVLQLASLKDSNQKTISASCIVNCTGPEAVISKSPSALIADLIEREIVVPDDLQLGLKTDEFGRLKNKDNSVNDSIWVIGSLRRGTLWETTALRELREQAVSIASLLN